MGAVLRKSCSAIEHCFFTLQTVALSALLLDIADIALARPGSDPGEVLPALLPGSIITLGLTRVFLCAAGVTDKCARVPALVNSLSFGNDLDHDRQYVVEYIIHSAAGFYVFEVRLTSAMVLKFCYLSCVLA